jgi:hypothetical protein
MNNESECFTGISKHEKTMYENTNAKRERFHTLDKFRSRTRTSRRRENGVLCPCMDMPRHFHVVFDVRVLDLNLSIGFEEARERTSVSWNVGCIILVQVTWIVPRFEDCL